MVDYLVFDAFLSSCNWSMFHPLDKQRFHKALAEVITNEDFSVQDMEEYMLSFTEKHPNSVAQYSVEMMRNKIPSLIIEAENIEAYLNRDNW